MGDLLDKFLKLEKPKSAAPIFANAVIPEPKKLSEKKIIPGEKNQKVAHARPEKKDIQDKKSSINNNAIKSTLTSLDQQLIDQKINEIVNDRILKLVKGGLRHELTQENLLRYIKTHTGTKEYKLADFFDADIHEIRRIMKDLHSARVIKKDKNNFYHLK